MQLQKCASVPTRYQSQGEFFAIYAILTVRGLACSERCLKVTNLSCIAVFSPSISLSRHYTELTKSLFDLFGKFFHIWAVDSIILQKGRELLLHANIAAYAKNGNLMFLSPWGEFFTSYHVNAEIVFLCFVHDILADCDWNQILQKHFFPVSIFQAESVRKNAERKNSNKMKNFYNSDMFGDYMFNVFSPRDVSISARSRNAIEKRTFFISTTNCGGCRQIDDGLKNCCSRVCVGML